MWLCSFFSRPNRESTFSVRRLSKQKKANKTKCQAKLAVFAQRLPDEVVPTAPQQPDELCHEGTLKTKCVWRNAATHAGVNYLQFPLLRQHQIKFTHVLGRRDIFTTRAQILITGKVCFNTSARLNYNYFSNT